jgi:hypothetical protein
VQPEYARGNQLIKPTRVVDASEALRKMRGGSQAHLLRTDDGRRYVTKFFNNPQFGRRLLVNEYIASSLFDHLGICSPPHAVVRIGRQFLQDNPAVRFTVKHIEHPVRCGKHFGSMYPGDPVYDFLPDALLPRTYNLQHFCGALVLDKWLSNADGRQAVFFRAEVKRPSEVAGSVWVAQMIDNGHAFQGAEWTFRDSAVQGLYGRRIVYGPDPVMADFEPWLEAIRAIDRCLLERIADGVPRKWIAGDELELSRLLDRLYRRRDILPSLVAESIDWLRQRMRPMPAIDSTPIQPIHKTDVIGECVIGEVQRLLRAGRHDGDRHIRL